MDSRPLVSVAMTAYNSEAWLPRAINSVLRQQTDFAFELVIADDCSQDGTRDVMRSYQKQHPTIIRLLEREKNLGMQLNFFDTFEQCRGKYIAWLDADDYWTDETKLARQVAVMESDATVSVCSHFVRTVTETGAVLPGTRPLMKAGRYGAREIIRHNFVPSPSIVFRNGVQKQLPSWYFELQGLSDWPVLIQSALSGDIVLLDRVMADYAHTPGSAYGSKDPLYQESVDLHFCQQMTGMLPPALHRFAFASMGKRYEAIAYLQRKRRNYAAACQAAMNAFRIPDAKDNVFSKTKTLAVCGIAHLLHPLNR